MMIQSTQGGHFHQKGEWLEKPLLSVALSDIPVSARPEKEARGRGFETKLNHLDTIPIMHPSIFSYFFCIAV